MTRAGYNPDLADRHEFPELEATHGEDPSRFLQANRDLALARIAGIRDLDVLDAYRTVEQQITDGDGPGRRPVLDALDARERELTGAPTPDAEPTPVPATDGGVTVDQDQHETTDETHPDALGLEAGQVVVVDRGETTEYVWPATPASDEPYLLRTFDAEGTERTDGAIGLTSREMQQRLDYDTGRRGADDVPVESPRGAARNGGDE